MATLVNYTCKRFIKLKPGLVSRRPPRLSRNLSNPDCVTGLKQIVPTDTIPLSSSSSWRFFSADYEPWGSVLSTCTL